MQTLQLWQFGFVWNHMACLHFIGKKTAQMSLASRRSVSVSLPTGFGKFHNTVAHRDSPGAGDTSTV